MSAIVENFEFEDKHNPWIVTTLDAILYFCCPECFHKEFNKSAFLEHATSTHPNSKELSDKLDENKPGASSDTDELEEKNDALVKEPKTNIDTAL